MANFANQINVNYDSATHKTILGIDTASYTNDDTLTLNGRYTLSSVEMGNRRYQSDTKSELLLQFEEVSAETSSNCNSNSDLVSD